MLRDEGPCCHRAETASRGATPQPGFTGWNTLADDGFGSVRRTCNDGPASRFMIFLLNPAVLADQKCPHQAAENVQPRVGR
jgi:hypothetical protein